MEIVLSLVIFILVFWVLVPHLINAVQYLFVAVVYMAVVIAAFAITAFVLLSLFFEPNELSLDDPTSDAVLYLETTSFWIWSQWT